MREKGRYCAIRPRNTYGSPQVGSQWLEPMGSINEFVDNPETWEVLFYNETKELPE